MADKVVVDGELSMDTIIDGDLSLEQQIKGETESVIKIEPKLEPITVSKNGMFLPSEGMDGFSSVTVDADIEDDYEWRKPEEWPDLESIELPGSWDVSTVYFLYDRSCGNDVVKFSLSVHDVYKGTITNGEFIGEKVASNAHQYTDTLDNDYVVYKFVCKSSRQAMPRLSTATNYIGSYSWNMQGLVWIYGEVPNVSGEMGADLVTPFLRRMKLTHISTKLWLTFPPNFYSSYLYGVPFDTSISYEIGTDEPNNWGGFEVDRTGNGPITPPIKQKSDYILKNVNFKASYGNAQIAARNVVLVNPSGTLKNGQYANDQLIEKFVVRGGTLKVINAATWFSSCFNLHTVDMSDVDFSENTNSGATFNQCRSLKNLKLNSSWSLALDLGACACLSKESVLNLFDVLPVVTTTRKITLHSYVKRLLTPEEIAIVTQKGWTVA